MALRLYWEADRLKTFKKWPFGNDSKCNAQKMAEAGFYACGKAKGEEDLAKCFFCGKELDGWESDDDPWVEHRKHSNPCQFLAAGKTEREMTAEEHLQLLEQMALKEIKNRYTQRMQRTTDEVNEILSSLIIKRKRRK